MARVRSSIAPRERLARARFRRWFGRYFAAAFAVFALGAVLGAVVVSVVDLGGLQGVAEQLDPIFPDEITFWFLAVNNLRVAGVLTLGFVSFGVISVAILFFNGFVVGLVLGGAAQDGALLEALALIVPHGVLELGAFFLVGGLTFRVAHRLIDYLRGVDETAVTAQEAFEAVVLLVAAALAIVVAAWIEVHLTERIARALVGPL